jgi:hypothetical protein
VKARSRSLGALIFDGVLLAFTVALVIDMFGLGRGARLVPLIVGVPTLVGLVFQLIFDLFPDSRDRLMSKLGWASSSERLVGADDAEPGTQTASPNSVRETRPDDAGDDTSGKNANLDETPEARKRELILATWVVGFFVLSLIFGLLVSVPIALFFFLKVLNRDSWLFSITVTVVTWATIYVLFGVVLGVRFFNVPGP